MSRDWTPEQIRNAQTYGVCLNCGEPRYSQMLHDGEPVAARFALKEARTLGGIWERKLVCPNGHPQ